ncbi:MAG: DNA translocase FtsK [Ruminococcus sp.]|jgi:S-DNA-T family DNA segregation ATPase FtsK/SpoIIIE|nr:DNA translocase FtsK [Ruminococcus sp.]
MKEVKNDKRTVLWSAILFAMGILTLAFSIFEGTSAWAFIHNILLGMFSIGAYIIPVIFIYMSVMIALADERETNITAKVIQCFISVFLITGMLQIFLVGEIPGKNILTEIIPTLYDMGKELQGGGVFALPVAGILLPLFAKTGSAVIIILALFVYVMILTDKTILDLWRAICKLLGIGTEEAKERKEQRKLEKAEAKTLMLETKRAEKEAIKAEKSRLELINREAAERQTEKQKNFIVDIPIDGVTEIENSEPLPFDIDENPAATIPATTPPITPPITPIATPVAANSNTELSDIIKKAAKDAEEKANKPLAAQTAEADNGIEIGKHTTLASNKVAAGEEFFMPEAMTAADIQREIEIKELYIYRKPPLSLLTEAHNELNAAEAEAEMKQNADTLVETLGSFGVQTRIVDIHRGPTVTRYELQPSAGVKISKITNLSDDIALNLAAAGVRIEAPIPGKAAVGVEVPNKIKDIVSIRELIESGEFKSAKSKLSFVVGKNIDGEVIVGDIAKMPHIIIAGTTGSGKSVCTNSIIMSILYNSSPDDVRMVLIDPKMVEFKTYDGIPHLLIPVVTDPRKAAGALSWAVQEMLKRYKLFADSNVRDLTGYNDRAAEIEGMELLPRVVIVIDELADLMMAAASEVEDSICRLAQMARAAGMHLIIATQRPTVDVITGLIKANIPSRIALTVSSQIDSRTIIDTAGAEKLLGNGDMLYFPSGIPKPLRVQGCFVSTKEVESVVGFIKNGTEAEYSQDIIVEIEKNMPAQKGEKTAEIAAEPISDGSDEDYKTRAAEALIEAGQASVSYLQRKLKLGYARAARIMDELEADGVVGPYEGSKPRAVLITKQQWLERKLINSDKVAETAG